jgi:hypothetical protein
MEGEKGGEGEERDKEGGRGDEMLREDEMLDTTMIAEARNQVRNMSGLLGLRIAG